MPLWMKLIVSVCSGKRLKQEALYFKIDEKNIADLAQLDIVQLAEWFDTIEKRLSEKQLTNRL